MAPELDGATAGQLRAILSRLRPGERRLTVLTGAGVSTESGVPDFRSPDSPWRVHAPINYQAFMSDPALRAEALRRKFAMDDLYFGAEPARSHRALVSLANLGLIRAVVTQNIDGLHQAAGLDSTLIVELHGSGTYAHCLSCGRRYGLAEVRRELETTGEAPVCACGGFIKSATVAFGQPLDPAVIAAAVDATAACDVFLVVGTSLVVRPAATLPLRAKANGAHLAIINREPTPLDAEADTVLQADAGEILEKLAVFAQEQHVASFGTSPRSGSHY